MIIALAFLAMIAFVGFAVDTGIIYLHRAWLGQAVDAASLAAGYELPNIKGSCARAVEYLEANGYEAGLDFSFQVIYPSRPDAPVPPGDPGEFVIDSIDDSIIDPADCASVAVPSQHDNMHFEVRVSATQQVPVIFMHMLGFGEISVTAPSTTERSDSYDIVLILDRSGSMKFDTCMLVRPEDEYGCENRYKPCTALYSEDFQSYSNLNQVESAGWTIIGNAAPPKNVSLKKPGDQSIELTCKRLSDPKDPGPYTYDFSCTHGTVSGDVQGYTNVLLDDCNVTGSVIVTDGIVDIINGSVINDNVDVEDSYLKLDDSDVVGNVEAKINSNPDVDYVITGSHIYGSAVINDGGRLQMTGTIVEGDLDADCPTIVITESGNTVYGDTTICGDDPPLPTCGAIYRTISTVGCTGDVALFFTAEENNLEADDALQVFWRPNSSVGWSQIAEYSEGDIPDGEETAFGVVLPSSANNNPNLQIRFELANHTSHWLRIDEIQLRVCQCTPGPWVWYEPDWEDACWEDPGRGLSLACDTDDWDTVMPGVSRSGDEPPLASFMEQPMLDALLASSAFIDIVDSRRVGGAPREDRIGLVAFDSEAARLYDLTTDYEAIKEELFTNLHAYGGTNFGGGMRAGLSVLGDARWDSTHYMILLSDGWPNFYDSPFDDYTVSPTTFGINCGLSGNVPCAASLIYIDEQIEAANAQNVTIFTIGLGEAVDTDTFEVSGLSSRGWPDGDYTGMDILERIANDTNGQAYHAPTTEELDEIFAWIAEAIFIRIVR